MAMTVRWTTCVSNACLAWLMCVVDALFLNTTKRGMACGNASEYVLRAISGRIVSFEWSIVDILIFRGVIDDDWNGGPV